MIILNVTLLVSVAVMVVCVTFALGYVLGVYHKIKDTDNEPKPVGIYPCCDHCYLPDGMLGHGEDTYNIHTVPCNEIVRIGNSRVRCQI